MEKEEVLSMPTEKLNEKFFELIRLKRFLENTYALHIDNFQKFEKAVNENKPSEVVTNVEQFEEESFRAGVHIAGIFIMQRLSSNIDDLISVLKDIKQELENREKKEKVKA